MSLFRAAWFAWLTLLAMSAFGLIPARAAVKEDVVALYQSFVAAQNAHDLAAVARNFLDSEDFLWVSDGKSVWGKPATLARMSSFQQSEVWRVEPDLAHARAVELGPDAAYLHLTLDLVIGAKAKPDRLPFLVSMLAVRTPAGWRIAALFTTTAKPE